MVDHPVNARERIAAGARHASLRGYAARCRVQATDPTISEWLRGDLLKEAAAAEAAALRIREDQENTE